MTTAAAFGLPEAVTYITARTPGFMRPTAVKAAILLTVAGVAATAAVWLSLVWLSRGDASLGRLIAVASLAITPQLLVGLLRGMAAGLELWTLVATERVFSSGLRVLALIPFWLNGTLSPLVATVILAAMPLIGAASYVRLIGRAPAKEPGTVIPPTWGDLTGFGGRLWIGSISGIILLRLDQSLMTPLTGSYQLGLYVVAVSVSELPLVVNVAIRDVTFASAAAGAADDRLAMSARISGTLTFLVALGVGGSMFYWLPPLFGAGFRGSLPVAVVLLVGVVVSTPGSIGGAGLSGRGRPGLRSIGLLIACVVNVALLLALVPSMGALGAAYATLAGSVIAQNMNLVFLWRIYGMPMHSFYGFRRQDAREVSRLIRRLLPGRLR